MTEILILYILSKYDATLYKIRKLILEKFFCYSSPSLGAVSPALKRLEALSCVEFESSMSEGGLLSKTYKITSFGMKYLKSLLASFEFKNKAHIINDVSIFLCVSDILEQEEKQELFKNCINRLLLLKADINNALENPYVMYNDVQKKVMHTNIQAIDSLIGVMQ